MLEMYAKNLLCFMITNEAVYCALWQTTT